jgi:hypothetical protein
MGFRQLFIHASGVMNETALAQCKVLRNQLNRSTFGVS